MVAAVAVLHNESAGTFHPIIFRDAPLPGPEAADKPRRLKSIGHHTSGFPTLEDAAASVRNDERMRGAIMDVEHPMPWDGLEVPASVVFVDGERVISLFGDAEG